MSLIQSGQQNNGAFPTQVAPSEVVRVKSPSEVFDQLSRMVASGMPRREAFKLVFKGLAGMAFLEFGINNAWADGTCLCNGATYSPLTQCCTSSGVQAKYPITNTANCPNKSAHPGYVATFDGCGSKTSFFNPNRVPQGWGAADFSQCCNAHDICYGTCNNNKSTCDSTFLGCLSSSCNATYPVDPLIPFSEDLNLDCNAAAVIYYTAVALGGGTAFEAGQDIACDCCSVTTCADQCAGSVCGGFSSCGPGGDCVCFTSTEGTGACAHGDTPCAGIQSCVASSDCPSGSACIISSCCGAPGVCVPLCNPLVPAVISEAATTALNLGPTAGSR